MNVRILTITLISLFLFASSASAASFAYITNYYDNTVSVLDTTTDSVTATVDVGSHPQGVAVDPAGTKVYVVNRGGNTVSVIDTATNTVTATINVGNTPHAVAVNPAGTRAYITNVLDYTVSVIDTATNTVTANVKVGTNPYCVALNPSGTRAYVTNRLDNYVSVIDTATETVIASVNVGDLPWGVVVNPSGTRAYVTKIFGYDVAVIDTATNTVIATVGVGSQPTGIAINPEGTKVYVANTLDNSVSVIDTTTNTVSATLNVGSSPHGVAVNPAGTKLYVANHVGNTVSVIDTTTNTLVATVNVGKGPLPLGMFIGPDITPAPPTETPTLPPEPPNNPPDSSHAYPSVGCLWPPNHKSVDVTIEGVIDLDGDPVSIIITAITANEPLAPGDVSGVSTGTAKLTAERNGEGNGRKYTIAFTASDGKGEGTPGTVHACVPHDQGEPCTCDAPAVLPPTGTPTVTPLPTPVPATPVADFIATPIWGVAPLEVSFTDQSTNSPTAWFWNFGDGMFSTAQNPVHTYPMHLTGPGVYTVSLTASNAQGNTTLTRPDYITVTLFPWDACPHLAAGVFELIVPEGSSWKIRGPYGYLGPGGTPSDAPWEPISGTRACIGTDRCDLAYTVSIQGPDGTVKAWELPSLGENCHVVLTY